MIAEKNKKCDGYNQIHEPIVISDSQDGALRVYCSNCREVYVTRMDEDGRFDRLYRDLFMKDAIQPPHNQYFRLHPELMSIIQ